MDFRKIAFVLLGYLVLLRVFSRQIIIRLNRNIEGHLKNYNYGNKRKHQEFSKKSV